MSPIFKSFLNFSGSLPPDEPRTKSKTAAIILCIYFALGYMLAYYINQYSCMLDGLPGKLQYGLNFLFSLFLNDVNKLIFFNINCFKMTMVFIAILTFFFFFVSWHFEKTRLIATAEKGIAQKHFAYSITYIIVLCCLSFSVVPYVLLFNITPYTGPTRPLHFLYKDATHWVPQATRALASFFLISYAILELRAQIIARRNINQRKG